MIILIWVGWEREREFHISPRVTSVRWEKSIIFLSCCVNIQIQGEESRASPTRIYGILVLEIYFHTLSHFHTISFSSRLSSTCQRRKIGNIRRFTLSLFHIKTPTHFCLGVISALCVCWIFHERARELRNEVHCFVYYQILLFPIKIREHSSPRSSFFCCLHAYTTTKSDAPSARLALCVRNISENVCRFSHRFMSSCWCCGLLSPIVRGVIALPMITQVELLLLLIFTSDFYFCVIFFTQHGKSLPWCAHDSDR